MERDEQADLLMTLPYFSWPVIAQNEACGPGYSRASKIRGGSGIRSILLDPSVDYSGEVGERGGGGCSRLYEI